MPDAGAEFAPIPSADEVRAELERIVTSEPFRPSAQLQAFLRFVVEATLKGEAGGSTAAGGTLSVSSGRFYLLGELANPDDTTLLVKQSGSST